ncbi:helix-turn-helix domain-containing protein [Ktedonosporobacter rubrisoli]|uniref:Helix-turn-helix domain-containing protein n=1 Tax=Ktedonosporobacter rubrisoli TaxID=2509675 RepID=A0A4P6JZV9_KTERU|nr:helix-turn-helix domain-containing protein [Ktedonosporobacter rubrisoli]QBD80920.1 helix-turn-helix domain-containing protein [Ktedonosporobacter rubrisoli]
MDFPQRLKSQRILRGWSQAKLAEELGTTPNTISVWERGISLPSPYFREKLCALLAMNARELGLVIEDEVQARASLETEQLTLNVQEVEAPVEPLGTAKAPGSTQAAGAGSLLRQGRLSFWQPASFIKRRWLLVACIILLLAGSGIGLTLLNAMRSSNPYMPYQGTLVLDDSLSGQDNRLNWMEGWNKNQASCQFKDGAYYSQQPQQGYFHACIAQKTDFSNFAYEVEMTLYEGDYGGIIFRAKDSLDDKYYLFRVATGGTFMLKQYLDGIDAHAVLLDQGHSSAFRAGFGQQNRLAVVAQNDLLTLYLNGQEVASVHDSSYLHGQIGVLAGNDTHAPARVAFTNAKVWSW